MKGFVILDKALPLQHWVDQSIQADEVEKGKRKNEVSEVYKFRNKIAAHTSYAYPFKDSVSTQMTSLATLTSAGWRDDLLSFELGGVKVELAGVSDTEIPEIGIHSLHPEIIKHFSAWEEMFCSKLREAKGKLPIECPEYKVYARD